MSPRIFPESDAGAGPGYPPLTRNRLAALACHAVALGMIGAFAVNLPVAGQVGTPASGRDRGAEADYNAPWPEAEKKGLWPPGSADQRTTPPSGESEAGSARAPSTDLFSVPGPLPPEIKVTRHEVSASADFLIGQGDVSLPIGFSLRTDPLLAPNAPLLVVQPDRDSQYFGASVSYSFGQAWYIDLNYQAGESSGQVDLNEIAPGTRGDFKIDDEWYQAYVRYTFPALRGRKFSAYARAGVTYVESDLELETTVPPLGFYTQDNQTEDITGNLGFGMLYSLYTSRRVRLGVQLEAEGFYGIRTQESKEDLPQSPGIQTTTASIDNDLYGGLGRATLRFEYRVGKSGLLKVFADGGVQARYTFVDYPGLDTFEELLWGPYAKVGLRYAF